jgi:hypothetical protein
VPIRQPGGLQGLARALKCFVDHPVTKLGVGLILIASGLIETYDTVPDGLHRFRVRVGHLVGKGNYLRQSAKGNESAIRLGKRPAFAFRGGHSRGGRRGTGERSSSAVRTSWGKAHRGTVAQFRALLFVRLLSQPLAYGRIHEHVVFSERFARFRQLNTWFFVTVLPGFGH